jgi:GNAT superfamily N-acetyltransferase
MSLLYVLCLPRRAERLWGTQATAAGSANQRFYIDDGVTKGFATHRTYAFAEISLDFLGAHYYPFFDLDDSSENVEEAAEELVDEHWDELKVSPRDQVFVLHAFQLSPELRGRGEGRAVYRQLEDWLRKAGVKAIILQAGELDGFSGHSLGFWRKMGFEEWPGDYWMFDDRIMTKVIA